MTDAPELIDLVLFEIAGTRYGADLTQVRRIDRVEPLETVPAMLGEAAGRRALVFVAADGVERKLAIDQVYGVRAVPVSELRRLPPVAKATPLSVGAWLDGDDTVLLVDLQEIAPSSPRSPNHGQ